MLMHTHARFSMGALLLALFLTPGMARAQGGMAGMAGMEGMQHAMPGPLGIPIDRMGSGTTWIPDAVPVPSRSWTLGPWHVMAHGVAFLQYDYQDGPRGDSQIGSLNWLMLMASREFLGGQIQPRVMISLDPATVGGRGYPLLLQTGETHKGNAIRDRQHPHDFWMELALLYERELTPSVGISLYGAPAGEPALGPVAFMHRPSALDYPFAPLSHHWQDATHISFGVVTAGIFGRKWKVEGSAFNGQEPDDQRWGFDALVLDSYSGRVTVNPSASLSFTAGYGRLDTPELLHAEESIDRFVASALFARASGTDTWSAAAIWGQNRPVDGDMQATNAALLETSLTEGPSTVLARLEYVEKSAEDLVLPPSSGVLPERVFGVGSFSMGYIRELGGFWGLTGGIGALATMNVVDKELERFYASRNPFGGAVFVRVRPKGGGAGEMEHMMGMGQR
jgi:hypothetical protein